MSCTEIYGLKKNSVVCIGETRNAWRGAMAVWKIIEKKYLPKFVPKWGSPCEEYSRTTCLGSDKGLEEIWDLYKSPRLPRAERIVLGSTFDNVLVKVDRIAELLSAFREFEGETSLKEQADIIERTVREDPEIVAIGWNQTSVNGDTWATENYDEKEDVHRGYNLETGTKHWFLLEKIDNLQASPIPVSS